jgi:hypothetical protein
MRPMLVVGLLGTALSVSPAVAQSAGDQPSGEQRKSTVPASNKRRSTSAAMDALSENGPARPNALEEAKREGAIREKQPEAEAGAKPGATPVAPPAVAQPTVQAVPPGPPQKNLTGEEFHRIRVGSTSKEVLAVLGPPSSRVVIPDDDDHLRETLQYWVKGVPMATVRLDNGRVVEIQTQAK